MTSAHLPPGWSVTRLGGAFGVQLGGADLRSPPSAAKVATLERLLAEHLVVVVPEQSLTPYSQVSLGRRLGDPYIHPFLEAIVGHPEVLAVVKEADEFSTFGGEYWHADITFERPPSSISLLQADELPPTGGDTLFADQYAALATLSERLQDMLRLLEAVHVYPGLDEREAHASAVHPVVRRHPVSGRDALFVNRAFTQRFEGMTAEESRPLLEFLFAHQTRPEFISRIGWAEGQLTLWDNRAVQHHAMNDHAGYRRALRRVTVMERC